MLQGTQTEELTKCNNTLKTNKMMTPKIKVVITCKIIKQLQLLEPLVPAFQALIKDEIEEVIDSKISNRVVGQTGAKMLQ